MIYGTPDFKQLLFDMISNQKRHSLYEESVKAFNKMKPHIYGDIPKDLLERTRPREPEEVKQYRIANYEATTKSTASKALGVLAKIMNPSFYDIRWKAQTPNGKILQDYTLEYYPYNNSVIKFMGEAGLKRMIADANGAIAIRPKKLPENELEQAKPLIVLYGSPAIWWKDEECYIIHTKEEETKNGIVHSFTYYDNNFVVDFTAGVLNAKEVVTNEPFIYATEFKNEMPIWDLQGDTETTDEGLTYYVSFFEPALPFWNLAITHESDVFAAYISHLHPIKIEVVEDCDFIFEDQRCTNGRVTIPYGDGIKIKDCPGCHGTGKKNASGAYGVHYVSHDKLKDGTGGTMTPVQYATIPTEPTKMLEAHAERMHIKGLEALNMDVVDKVGENQSGVAKVIDRGELYEYLSKVASVVFDTHITNIFYFFNKYMFGVIDSNPNRKLDNNLPEINKPTKFDISSTPELTAEYGIAKQADVNPEYLRQKMISLASKEFANTPDIKKEVILTIELDPLPGMSVEQAEALLAGGIISKRDAVLHFQMGKFISQALTDDKQFGKLPSKEKLLKLYKYADAFISENKITLDTSLVYDPAASIN